MPPKNFLKKYFSRISPKCFRIRLSRYCIFISFILRTQLMEYQNLRGGRIVFQIIKAPKVEWATQVTALEDALNEEKTINESLIKLHAIASATTTLICVMF